MSGPHEVVVCIQTEDDEGNITSDIDYRVFFYIHPAEPDVGIMQEYIEIDEVRIGKETIDPSEWEAYEDNFHSACWDEAASWEHGE